MSRAIINNTWPHQQLQNLGGINQNHVVYYNGTVKRIMWCLSIFKWHILTMERQVRWWWQSHLVEGNFPQRARTLAGRPLEQLTVTATAYYMWAANHSENEQKHSRSGRMKRCTLSPSHFFPVKEACAVNMWGLKTWNHVESGKIWSTSSSYSVVWQNCGRRWKKKRFWGRNIHDSPLASVKHSFVYLTQLCSTEPGRGFKKLL